MVFLDRLIYLAIVYDLAKVWDHRNDFSEFFEFRQVGHSENWYIWSPTYRPEYLGLKVY